MLLAQNGKCAICGTLPEPGRLLCVDHRHSDGVVRGLLCDHCNTALGHLRDNPILMQKAIEYIEKSVRRF